MGNNKFVKIKMVDDWCNVGYYLKVNATQYGTSGHSTQDQSYRIKNNDKFEIMLPDGHVIEATAKITVHHTSYNDMGHTYNTTTERLKLVSVEKLKCHGLNVDITDHLEKIKVRRLAKEQSNGNQGKADR